MATPIGQPSGGRKREQRLRLVKLAGLDPDIIRDRRGDRKPWPKVPS